MYTDLATVVPLYGCHGDCTTVCDDVALESKFLVDIIDCCSCHCRQGHLEVVQFLLTEGKADVSVKDISGRTPLHYASE